MSAASVPQVDSTASLVHFRCRSKMLWQVIVVDVFAWVEYVQGEEEEDEDEEYEDEGEARKEKNGKKMKREEKRRGEKRNE